MPIENQNANIPELTGCLDPRNSDRLPLRLSRSTLHHWSADQSPPLRLYPWFGACRCRLRRGKFRGIKKRDPVRSRSNAAQQSCQRLDSRLL